MEVKTNFDEKSLSNQMSQYNFTIQRCLKVLKQKQAELDALIRHEENERITLQDEVEKITYKLGALNKIKSQRILMKENYENLIHAIEDDYQRIATLSETLSKTAEQHCLELLDESPVQLKRSNTNNQMAANVNKRSHSKQRGDNCICPIIGDVNTSANESFIHGESLEIRESESKITNDSSKITSTNKSQSSSKNSQTAMDNGSGSNQILFIKAYKKRKSNVTTTDVARNHHQDTN